MAEYSSIIDLLTLIAILSGLAFGVAEIRRSNRARKDEAAINVFSTLIDAELMVRFYQMPEYAPAELVSQGVSLELEAQEISNQMEIWGILVYQRKIDLHAMDLMVGGVVRQLWNRLQNWTFAQREKYSDPNFGEWFQWLAERLEEYPAPQKSEGAYKAFRNWKP